MKPLVAIAKRTDPLPARCELACGHVYVHPVGAACSSMRHYCAECPSDRPDDQIVAGGVYDPGRLVEVEDDPPNVVRLVPR